MIVTVLDIVYVVLRPECARNWFFISETLLRLVKKGGGGKSTRRRSRRRRSNDRARKGEGLEGGGAIERRLLSRR